MHSKSRRSPAGSVAAGLHDEALVTRHAASGTRTLNRFLVLRWVGVVGALLIGVGALGAGALPVVGNPYVHFPAGSLLSRMLQTSSAVVFIGVALMVVAWVLMAPFVGVGTKARESVSMSLLKRTFAAWTAPILITAPIFTQDIYSYLAQGSIVAQGMDPYAAGPVQLLGAEHHLARSVPFIWAESPSPYGPMALGIAAAISRLTGDAIVWGVLAHRLTALLGLIAAGWAVARLARRCHVNPPAAVWLGLLNPLTLLHLIGGIHNEALLLGFMLVGMEVGLRGVDRLRRDENRDGWLLVLAAGALISCAGLVKVTGFLALGFVGMSLARYRHERGAHPFLAIVGAAAVKLACLVITTAAVSALTGIGLGWITGQGGAATIRSWMSVTTDVGVVFGWFGMLLNLGDHTDAVLSITRAIGVLVATAFILRMLFATFRGTIHPVGGLGVGTFVLVILFPVVHPWYMLWAILPLAAWANRSEFRIAVVAYSAAMSFFVLPRGLSLPPATVLTIYVAALLGAVAVLALGWLIIRRSRAMA